MRLIQSNELLKFLEEETNNATDRIKKIFEARQAYKDLMELHTFIDGQYGHNIPVDVLQVLQEEVKHFNLKYCPSPNTSR
jgi:hypothetical protein